MKILYCSPPGPLSFSDLRRHLSEFTIYHGCFPEVIYIDSLIEYSRLLVDPPRLDNMKFLGIKVEEI